VSLCGNGAVGTAEEGGWGKGQRCTFENSKIEIAVLKKTRSGIKERRKAKKERQIIESRVPGANKKWR
jgi:hypothetical protein